VDRYLASLRASAPAYEDPYAPWGGARPALQYGLPPEQPRPDTTGWTTPLADYGMGHVPAGMPPMGAPAHSPWPATIPGGPLPSTPGGTILPGGGGGDARRGAAAFGITDPRAAQRFDAWVDAAHGMGLDYGRAEATAAGGIRWAEENEPADQRGWARSGANLSSYAPNTLNPAQAVSFYGRGGAPNQYQLSGRADVGGNARNLTSIAPPGQAIPDAAHYIVDPLDRAAAHITQAVAGGSTGGQAMAAPGYDPGAGGGVPGLPGAGGGGAGGGLSSYNAGQLLFDPAALQAYIAQQSGTPVGRNTFRDQYTRQAIVPLVQSALESLTGLGGETSADQLGQNLQHYLGLLRGQGGFGAIRGEATAAMGNPELWSNLGLLSDQEAAQRLNQLIGLGTVGTNELFSRAIQARAQNALTQRHVDQAMLPPGADTGTYAEYFKALPWLKMLGGGR
jgi:hypothetical protein